MERASVDFSGFRVKLWNTLYFLEGFLLWMKGLLCSVPPPSPFLFLRWKPGSESLPCWNNSLRECPLLGGGCSPWAGGRSGCLAWCHRHCQGPGDAAGRLCSRRRTELCVSGIRPWYGWYGVPADSQTKRESTNWCSVWLLCLKKHLWWCFSFVCWKLAK